MNYILNRCSLILNPSGLEFCDRASRLVERRWPLCSNSLIHSELEVLMVYHQSQATLSRSECNVTLPYTGPYDWNNQPRRCGIWVCRVSTSKMLTKKLTGMIVICWIRVTYLMQRQDGVSLRLAPALQISLLTRFVRTLANLSLLTSRQRKSGNYRLTSSLRSPHRRWLQLSLSAFLEMRTGS